MIKYISFLSIFLSVLSIQPVMAEKSGGVELRGYVGTYTHGDSQGIYRFTLNLKTGAITEPVLAGKSDNPSFLVLDAAGKHLFAVNELGSFQGKKTGAVTSFAVDRKTGNLTLINQQPSHGAAPCHIDIDRAGRHVLVANYTGGSVASFPVDKNGRLGEAVSAIQHTGSGLLKPRQASPHAHGIYLDADEQFAIVTDLGLDKLLVYRFDKSSGKLTPHDPPSANVAPGSGPRHFAFHPNGRFGYAINEITLTVTAFAYDDTKGAFRQLQTLDTVKDVKDRKGMSTAELHMSPDGKFLYGSNRGHDSVAIFSVDQKSGELTFIETQSTLGKTPRGFCLDPTGTFLLAANQSTNSIAVFRIDKQTGKLTSVGKPVEIPTPVCIDFVHQE